MAKISHDERLEASERENADLKRPVNLLELFVDSERRERSGVTLDEIRSPWGITSRTPVPEVGAV
jgi:hypothetical protein